MTLAAGSDPRLTLVDPATRLLVRLSAIVAAGSEAALRPVLVAASQGVPAVWVEELILQSYLFAGFPRALNAAREWRRIAPAAGAGSGESDKSGESGESGTDYELVGLWKERGEDTCAAVYGERYDQLRANIRALHPALDAWMIVEGYGKVLSRPGLDLGRRELCIVAACAASGQDRQLLSHMHGALNVGVAAADVDATLTAIADLMTHDEARRVRMLWDRVAGK
jgi:4-carboxymuconolactone decarboxylase